MRHMRALELEEDMALAGSDDGDEGCEAEPQHLGASIAPRQVPEAGAQGRETSATVRVPRPEGRDRLGVPAFPPEVSAHPGPPSRDCSLIFDTLCQESQHLQFMRALEMDEDSVL